MLTSNMISYSNTLPPNGSAESPSIRIVLKESFSLTLMTIAIENHLEEL